MNKNIAVLLLLVASLPAYSKTGLSDSEASRVLEEQMLVNFNFTEIPTGRVHFMNGFEVDLKVKEQPERRKFHPRKLAAARIFASIGLLRLQEVQTTDLTSTTFDIGLTSNGEKALDHRGENGVVYFKDSEVKVSRVVSNTERGSKDAENPEPRRLVLAEFKQILTPLGKDLSSRNPKMWGAIVGKIRAIIKYDPFKNLWRLECMATSGEGEPLRGCE